jgi:hypothetical protein
MRARFVGCAELAGAGLWYLGLVPHAARLHFSAGGSTWAEARDPHTAASPLEARLGEVASQIAGRSVSVRCDELSGLRDGVEPGGVVEFRDDTPANYARIRYDICTQLLRVGRDGGSGGLAEAEAVEVLAHESFHLRGVTDEAATECFAAQFVSSTARALGATGSNAQRLHQLALRAYAYHPPEYISLECRSCGALDLRGRLPQLNAAAS